MNANELAEIIQHLENARYMGASKAATMLRQQQERLTKYELRHAEQRKRIDELEHQQQAEIEALKQIIDANNLNQNIGQFVKPTNEPVAYVDNVWINRPDLAMDLGIGQMFSRCQLSDHQIPLYTHPVKELTDEEIGDFEYQIIRACGLSTANSDINPIGLRQIIKAILRKAQEK